jgi:hypothetical protein
MWSLVLFFLALNVAGYIVSMLGSGSNPVIAGVGGNGTSPYTPGQINSMFSLNVFSATNVGEALLAGGIVALFGLMLRQGIFAIYAILIFVLGLFFNVAISVLTGFMSFMAWVFAGTGLEGLGIVFEGFFLAFFFFYLASILSQRQQET